MARRKTRTPEQRRRTYIKEWREFRDMTLEDLAEKLDTSKATVSRIENRVTPYSQDFLELCADVLGVHQAVLLTRAPDDSDRLAVLQMPPTTRAPRRSR